MNYLIVALAVITCVVMILSVLFFPKLKIGKLNVDTYWLVVLIGSILIVLISQTNLNYIGENLIADASINPIKILVLFISMTMLSIFLDELGFFRYLASVTLKKAKTSQIKLFLYLYLIVSVLTVFTSNDVIILSFTPFICYFAKSAKIKALPYLAGEFVAANTWSMALIIGNPTNIYLGNAYGINFLDYVKVMALPTIASGIVAFLMLLLVYQKSLKEPITGIPEDVKINDKPLLIIGIIHLTICTIMLAIGSYINIEMWLVSLCAILSLSVCTLITCIIRKHKPKELGITIKRAPWQLIPFVLSMFIIILVLSLIGITDKVSNFFGNQLVIMKYGYSSFLMANLINNIPMSVLYCAISEPLTGIACTKAIFASIIGSNLGALLTPIGALAGIMWSSIIGKYDIKFGYLDFLKLGGAVALPTISVCLLILEIII